MKVLWHVNLLPPDIESELGLAHCVGGSWIVGLRNALMKYHSDIQLCFVSCYHGITEIMHGSIDGVEYYAIPFTINSYGFEKAIEAFQPDFVHLHGSESVNAYIMAQNFSPEKIVISIQGVVFECAEHYFDGIDPKYKKLSVVKQAIASWYGSVLMQCQHQAFVKGIPAEESVLRASNSVIGRTNWDKNCAAAMNAYAKYYKCNEILRDCFYSGQWDYASCEKYSIYISQAHYPIKGAHMLFKALGNVVKKYPETKLYIAGWPPPKSSNWVRQKISNYLEEYRSLLKRLAVENGLEDKIFYTGVMNEEQVKQRLLNTHIFISPSSIENESNALSEAKILGVPNIVSAVGGVQERVNHGVDGYLYDFYDTDKLAEYICELFAEETKCRNISEQARLSARNINDIKANADALAEIYKDVCLRINS